MEPSVALLRRSARVVGVEMAVDAKELQRGLADVKLQEPLEEDGVAMKEMESVVTKKRETVQEEQTARHESGLALDAPVGVLIEGEVVAFESRGESGRLME